MNKLIFRRQYILGSKPIKKFKNWENIKINDNVYVTAHPDLEIEQYIGKTNTITLLGFVIDPSNPLLSNYEIIKNICRNVSCFDEVLNMTYALSGRYIIIYSDKNETKIVNDLIGLREVYYTKVNGEIWCGSDSSILNNVLNLRKRKDPELIRYYESKYFKNNENPWFGNETIYENTYHLLPNFYFNYSEGTTSRYWINKENSNKLEEATEQISEILKNSLFGANLRYDLILPVTAGLDSRILLSATKNISDDFYYYVSKMKMKDNHPDIKIPSRLLPKLGLTLNTLNNMSPLRKDVENILKNNIELFRNGHDRNITTQYYMDNFSNKVNVSGVVSEVGRNYYGINHPTNDNIDSNYLMTLIEIPMQFSYVKKQLESWLLSAKEFAKGKNISVVNLFYWEQRMGNWGSLTANEEDIAIENFMPFNNRKLLMVIMSVDDNYRVSPDFILYKKVAENLWPEVLSEPINPEPISSKIFNKIFPKRAKNKIKYITKFFNK
ncbi:hypothetical protein [Aerococcus urinaeequi]|uniref:hypothetical protein n=1 Tax=Aerococcus urinaeequi TaxID=51665 RepID=UPI003D6A8BC6